MTILHMWGRDSLVTILENFQKVYTLGQEISIDEQMISFKGHLAFLQYMPKKPVK